PRRLSVRTATHPSPLLQDLRRAPVRACEPRSRQGRLLCRDACGTRRRRSDGTRQRLCDLCRRAERQLPGGAGRDAAPLGERPNVSLQRSLLPTFALRTLSDGAGSGRQPAAAPQGDAAVAALGPGFAAADLTDL